MLLFRRTFTFLFCSHNSREKQPFKICMPRPRRAVPCLPTAEQKRACKSLGNLGNAPSASLPFRRKNPERKRHKELYGAILSSPSLLPSPLPPSFFPSPPSPSSSPSRPHLAGIRHFFKLLFTHTLRELFGEHPYAHHLKSSCCTCFIMCYRHVIAYFL